MVSRLLFIIVTVLLASPSFKDESNSQKLATIIDSYESFELYEDKGYPLGRFEKELFAEEAEFVRTKLESLNKLSTDGLSDTELISKELLQFILQNKIDEYQYETYLNPIQSDQGFHLNLNYRVKPITDYRDAVDYLRMLNSIPLFVDQNIDLIGEGLKKGVSQPKVIFKGYESTYDDHIVDNPEQSYFYSPFKNLPSNISQHQKDSLQQAARTAIEKKVIPSFQKIKTFFEEQYIPNTRTAIGVSETPNGKEFYQNRINYFTTTDTYTAEDIHAIGLKEVERIKKDMDQVIEKSGFNGNFEDFLAYLRTDEQFYATTERELLMEARNVAKIIDSKLPRYFSVLPRRPYGVIKVPDAIAPKYTMGRYSEPRSKNEPGFYLVNTYQLESRPLYVLPSLTAHEAVPGHHLQISLNSELGDSIPDFRKNLYLSAFGEGWALYCEYLGGEMGIYETSYQEFGKLTYEMWRACRLVVDTGIHAKGWTREEAVDYLASHTALSLHEVNTEIDRYIAWPGQALSYKMGELKIRELREKAEKELSSSFDIRKFHQLILEQGTVTIPILERRVNAYIEENR